MESLEEATAGAGDPPQNTPVLPGRLVAGLSPATLAISATNILDMLVSRFLTEPASSSPDVLFVVTLPLLANLAALIGHVSARLYGW